MAYLYFPPLTWDQIHAGIKHADGFAQPITVIPTRQFPGWVNRGFLALVILGGFTALYLMAEAGRWAGHEAGWW